MAEQGQGTYAVQIGSMYGALKSKSPEQANGPPPGSYLDDPRHLPNETRMPWLRYFFPKDFEVREGSTEYGPFYQFFDVEVQPLQEDASVPPPAWAPNAYFRLSFTQHQGPPPTEDSMDVQARVPDTSSPLPDIEATDLTRGGSPLLREKAEEHLAEVLRFCRSVITFKARTWKDAFPLVDLLRGVLQYLLEQYEVGLRLAREYALRDALVRVEQERARLQAEHAEAMAAARAQWEADTEAKMQALKDAMRKQLAEELQAQMKALAEDRDKWMQRAQAGDAQIKKLGEQVAALERTNQALESQLESDKAGFVRQLAARDKEAREMAERMAALQNALAAARKCILEALQSGPNKAQIIKVALDAIHATLPGAKAYVAELKTKADADAGGEDPGIAFVKEMVQESAGTSAGGAVGGMGEEVAEALSKIAPILLSSPLGPGGTGTPMSSRPTSATHRSSSPSRPGSATVGRPGSASSGGPPLSGEELRQNLVFKYVAATGDQAFMVGAQLPYGTGVSWGVVPQGHAQPAQEVFVEDVAERDGVHLFRGQQQGGGMAHGSYLGVPLMGRHGEVVGLLGVDTVGTGGQGGHATLHAEDAQFVRDLASLINKAVAKDQDALADLMAKVTTIDEDELLEEEVVVVDPEQYADLPGGLKLFRDALDMLNKLSDADFQAFRSLKKVDDATLAVVRSVLAAAGAISNSDAEWDAIKGLITRELVSKLAGMDPKAAWAEWSQLCQNMKPLFNTEREVGKLDGLMDADGRVRTPDQREGGVQTEGVATSEAGSQAGEGEGLRDNAVGRALGRWMNAVRKISAANALRKIMEERLERANAALVRTFQGDGSSALQELRSYRVPPRITFAVLQAVLLLCGAMAEDEGGNWGRMRVLTNFKIIQKLTKLKPGDVAVKIAKAAERATRDVDEADVKKESVATLALFRWLTNFLKLCDLQDK